MHVKPLPWQGFPGIFSSIDRHTKQVVVSHLQREGRLPPWLASAFLSKAGHAVEHIDPPHWSKFQATDEATGVTLRGEADAIFRLADGSCAIVDYKTSRYNPDNRGQHRIYRAQLNAYAWIARRLDFPPVSRVWRWFTWSQPPATAKATPRNWWTPRDSPSASAPGWWRWSCPPDRLLPPLLRQSARIHALPAPPDARDGCRDCDALEGLLAALGA